VKKLLHLKQWLTVEETARHLAILFREDVTEADVLRLALDGHLTLSVNFVNRACGRCGPVLPTESHIKIGPKGASETEWLISVEEFANGDNKAFDYDEQPVAISGVWDLTMLGAERFDVEHRYQQLTGGPAVTLNCLEGPILRRDDGTYCQVMTDFSNKFADLKLLKKPHGHPDNFYPAIRLPADSVLVVRTSSLHAFEARLSGPSQKVETPIGRRERNTLLVLMAAVCKLANNSMPMALISQTGLSDESCASITRRRLSGPCSRDPPRHLAADHSPLHPACDRRSWKLRPVASGRARRHRAILPLVPCQTGS
jgi:hypothetical protein